MRWALLAVTACGFQGPSGTSGTTDAAALDAATLAIDAATCATATMGACPANYLFVANDCASGAGDFCIAKYEMKSAGAVAVSQPAGIPWGSITPAAAQAACGANGSHYHLVTNAEWMATARAIERTPANWSTTSTPFLAKGKTDNCASCPGFGCPGAASTDTDPCFETLGPGCANRSSADFRFNRTHQLPGGELIWDFAGNMFELIDHPPTINSSQGAWPGVSINQSTGAAFSPAFADAELESANRADTDVSPRMIPDAPVQNIGILYVTAKAASHVTRGGDFCGFAGIYSVALLQDAELLGNVGFRCAYK